MSTIFGLSGRSFGRLGAAGEIPDDSGDVAVLEAGWAGFEIDARLVVAIPAILFPIIAQQWSAFQPLGFVTTYRNGWRHEEWDYRFLPRVPASRQQYNSTGGSATKWF